MKTIYTRFLAFFSFFAIGATSFAQFADIQVIHNSPDAAAGTVDIYLNDMLAVPDLAFRTATPFTQVPAGMATVVVAPGTSMSSAEGVGTFEVELASGGSYIIVASGIVDTDSYTANDPFNLAIYDGARSASSVTGNTDVIVHHSSPGTPTVDVYTVGGAMPIVDDLAYDAFSDYLELPTADYELEITLADGTPTGLQYSAPLETLNLQDAAITVLASGFLDTAANNDGPGIGLFAATANGGPLVALPTLMGGDPMANVQVIHNSPDPAAALVDVYVNGDLTLDDFAFRTATPFVQLPAGVELSIAVAPSTSTSVDDALATQTFTLDENESYTLMAAGMPTTGFTPDQMFELVANPGAQITSGNPAIVNVLAFHGAPDAPTVDIVGLNGDPAINDEVIADDLAYGTYGSYVSLTTSNWGVDVRLGDGTLLGLSYAAPFETLMAGGASMVVMASGFLAPADNQDGAEFGLFAVLADGTVIPLPKLTLAQFVHASPDEAAAMVDVYIDGVLAADDLEYAAATAYTPVLADQEVSIAFAPSTSTSVADAIATFTETFAFRTNYIAVASGIIQTALYADAEPFDLKVYEGANIFADSPVNTTVLVHHASPGAPTVDIVEVGVGAGELVSDLSYGEFTADYVTVPTNNYYVQIRADGSDAAVVTYRAALSQFLLGGQSAFLFATGFLDPTTNNDGPAFQVYAAVATGTVLALPALAVPGDGNDCADAIAITPVTLGDECTDASSFNGTFAGYWNSTLAAESPECSGTNAIVSDTYFSFNSGSNNFLELDVTDLSEGTVQGISVEFYTACGTVAALAPENCGVNIENAPFGVNVTENTDYIVRMFTNPQTITGLSGDAYEVCFGLDFVESVEDFSGAAFNVFPNPNNGDFNIQLDKNVTNAQFEVVDLNGRIIASQVVTATANATVNMATALPAGMYTLRMIEANGTQNNVRFIVK